MCWSTGRSPIAQPPGSDTRASPQRASSGPSARIDARMVFTISYGASGQSILAAESVSPLGSPSACTPICASSERIVRTSLSFGTFVSTSGSEVSSAAHRMGSAAFLAPETRTSPCSGTPPVIASLSIDASLPRRSAPLRRRQRLHRQRMNFLAHALAQHPVDQLVLPYLAQAGEFRADDQRLEVPSVAVDRDVLADEPRLDRALDFFRSDRRHVGIWSMPKLVAALEHDQRYRAQCRAEEDDDREARRGCYIRQAEKAVAEAVDHIEERIEMRQRLPERRQRMDRVENAGQERQWHDDKILECRQLVEFVGPDSRDQSEDAQDGAAEQRERDRPQRMRRRDRRKRQRDDEHAKTHDEPPHHRAQHIGGEHVERRQRGQQDEDQVAGDLRLDHRR